jgi:hypothetical protein
MRRSTRLSLVLVVATAAVAAAPARSVAAPAEPSVVAVWALADGDTPLAGARVRILKGGAVLRQDNGTRRERTSQAGVSLLDLRRVPRRFTVEVVPRRRLGGSLRAVVRHSRSGAVVHVNPVTTLVADVLAAHRRRGRSVSLAHARRDVYRLLGIPRWQDDADLRSTDVRFDGDAYLRAARKAGGIDALNRTLVLQALRHHGHRHFRHARRSGRAAGVDWLSLVSDPTALVKELFKSLLKVALTKAAAKAGDAALGWALKSFGLNDDLEARQLAEIRQALDAIGKQLTQLENRVELAGFSTLVHQTDRTIGEIDYAASQVDLLTRLPANDPTKKAFTQTVVDYIGSHLRDAPDVLNQSLSSNVPLSDNLIKSASRLVKTRRGRFFDSADSAQVRSVYDYFAAYQARLAILLTEYFHAKPDTYAPQTVEAEVTRLENKVTTQAQSLKPPVPTGAVIDSRTGLMWTQQSTLRHLNELARIVPASRPWYGSFVWQPSATSTGVNGVPFTNWSVPVWSQLSELMSGWSGDSPLAWLRKEARFGPQDAPVLLLKSYDGQYRLVRTGNSSFRFRVGLENYDLRNNKWDYAGPTWPGPSDPNNPNWPAVTRGNEGLQSYVRAVIYVRKQDASESYWWT